MKTAGMAKLQIINKKEQKSRTDVVRTAEYIGQVGSSLASVFSFKALPFSVLYVFFWGGLEGSSQCECILYKISLYPGHHHRFLLYTAEFNEDEEKQIRPMGENTEIWI